MSLAEGQGEVRDGGSGGGGEKKRKDQRLKTEDLQMSHKVAGVVRGNRTSEEGKQSGSNAA